MRGRSLPYAVFARPAIGIRLIGDIFRRMTPGQWVASPLGGSATKVEPGGVDGWSWTPDDALLASCRDLGDSALAGAQASPIRRTSRAMTRMAT